MISKAQDNFVKADLTLREFAQAMQSLDLSGVPQEKRQAAVAEHFMDLMSRHITDPEERAQFRLARAERLYRIRMGS